MRRALGRRAAPLEKNIERACLTLAKKENWLLPKWESPGNSGVPDRILIGPDRQIAFVEFKTQRGRQTPLQKRWQARLEERGFHYAVVRSTAEFEQFLRSVS
jgi:hypothetical protein